MRLRTMMLLLSLTFAAFVMPLFGQEQTPEASPLVEPVNSLEGVNIYFTEANGESSRFDQFDPGLSRFAGLLRRQGANLYTLEWRTRFPTDADLIIVAGPITDFSADQTARLWAYTSNGGRLLLLSNPIFENQNRQAWQSTSGFYSLMWGDLSLRGRNDMVVTEVSQLADAEATEEPGATDRLVTRFAATNINAEHPITAVLTGGVDIFSARSIEFDSSLRDYDVTPLITTESIYYGEAQFGTYLDARTFEYNIGTDTSRGSLVLAVALDDPRSNTRIVLIGDREFATNGGGFNTSPPGSASFLYPNNVRFMLNAVAWLLDGDIEEYSFPTPGPSSTPTLTPSPTPTYTPTPSVTATPTPGA
ncbi:MAG: hypothetical protein IAE80_25065 [Anaerolinea sp.]|nr:hypothetical protein [Anaerolinea sp.]